jgi:hypothetical protein
MPKSKLPWPTLAPPGPSGRLDPVAVRKAILEVKAESEVRGGGGPGCRPSSGATEAGGTSEASTER